MYENKKKLAKKQYILNKWIQIVMIPQMNANEHMTNSLPTCRHFQMFEDYDQRLFSSNFPTLNINYDRLYDAHLLNILRIFYED